LQARYDKIFRQNFTVPNPVHLRLILGNCQMITLLLLLIFKLYRLDRVK